MEFLMGCGIRPSRPIEFEDSDSECMVDDEEQDETDSVRQKHFIDEASPINQEPSTSQAETLVSPPPSPSHGPSRSHEALSDDTDYNTYLTVMTGMTESDEELNQAIQASLEDQFGNGCQHNVPVQQLLNTLAAQINANATKFTISRCAVLDGAIRGFKRRSTEGVSQTADQALRESSMFEGAEERKNLALDSQALREDRYFIAGRVIAVSLVHEGPAPGFLSPTLFSCLSGSPEMAKPTLDDVADIELHEKSKKILQSATMNEFTSAIDPLLDYLTICGCLRPMKTLKDKQMLVEDILMFQVINRIRGPFKRFREGMKTLGVLQQIQQHPDAFRPLLCHKKEKLTADILDDLFQIRFSESGSNRRMLESRTIGFWRDYLQDAENEEGPTKLGKILTFATGASEIPPVHFSPQPSIDFLHNEVFNSTHDASVTRFPMANTCVN